MYFENLHYYYKNYRIAGKFGEHKIWRITPLKILANFKFGDLTNCERKRMTRYTSDVMHGSAAGRPATPFAELASSYQKWRRVRSRVVFEAHVDDEGSVGCLT